MAGNQYKVGSNLPGAPGNTASPGRTPGTKNRSTLLRMEAVERIKAEWDRRDDVAVEEGFASWLATLSSKDFLSIVKMIIPREVNVKSENAAEILAQLLCRANAT